MHIAVLMGGPSREREVSLRSGKAVVQALLSKGHQVSEVVVGQYHESPNSAHHTDLGLDKQLRAITPEVVFIALHGPFGEDGVVQGLLEQMGMPYTGSGILASALAMDKPKSKTLFASQGLPVIEGRELTSKMSHNEMRDALSSLGFPVFVKPAADGSSVGAGPAHDAISLSERLEAAFSVGHRVLVEKNIPGTELTVAVLDDRVLGSAEIRPKAAFYDYDAKYVTGETIYLCPPSFDASLLDKASRMALQAHAVLGCSGATRTDFLVDASQGLWLLEINTIPGLTPVSLLPRIAAQRGMSFADLCQAMIDSAIER